MVQRDRPLHTDTEGQIIINLAIAHAATARLSLSCRTPYQYADLPLRWNLMHTTCRYYAVAVWLSGNCAAHINEVTLCRARLAMGWVTVSRINSRCGTFISVRDQPPRSTQPGHPFVGMRNKYQP